MLEIPFILELHFYYNIFQEILQELLPQSEKNEKNKVIKQKPSFTLKMSKPRIYVICSFLF